MLNLFKMKKQNVIKELYDMQWYNLHSSQQRQVKCLIHCIQIGAVPTMGPFGPLNFESFADVSTEIEFHSIFSIKPVAMSSSNCNCLIS